jgi:pantoate--beta-alanine ligase
MNSILQIYKKKSIQLNISFYLCRDFNHFKMLIISKKSELIDYVSEYKEKNNQSVGFVPTMGFLHPGHGSLIQKSKSENGLTICDIFVNPLQFNEKSDFDNYPIDIEKDVKFLESIGCDVLYLPTHDQLYPKGHVPLKYDFEHLDTVMEATHRPGHFQGVAEVVRILFEIVKPNKAYFGEKDFQQLKVIEMLVKQFQIPVEIVPCPVIREDDGLAMSSRNARLTHEERVNASFIYTQMMFCIHHYNGFSPIELKKYIAQQFEAHPLFELEYFEFANRENLAPIQHSWNEAKSIGIFVAARLGQVRLIDNIILF